jgi:circadian clock protein KaiB
MTTTDWDDAVFGLVDPELLRSADDAEYDLTLFVNGASDLSARAIANAKELCDSRLAGHYALHVVDLNDDPTTVLSLRLLAAPTLVKSRPLPVRRIVGDLSHTDKVLVALGLPADEPTQRPRG